MKTIHNLLPSIAALIASTIFPVVSGADPIKEAVQSTRETNFFLGSGTNDTTSDDVYIVGFRVESQDYDPETITTTDKRAIYLGRFGYPQTIDVKVIGLLGYKSNLATDIKIHMQKETLPTIPFQIVTALIDGSDGNTDEPKHERLQVYAEKVDPDNSDSDDNEYHNDIWIVVDDGGTSLNERYEVRMTIVGGYTPPNHPDQTQIPNLSFADSTLITPTLKIGISEDWELTEVQGALITNTVLVNGMADITAADIETIVKKSTIPNFPAE